MALLLWMLVCGVLILVAADRLAPPSLDRRLQLLLLALALLPVASSLRPGRVYGPLDTNVPHLPWAAAGEDYAPKVGTLNDVTLQLVPWQTEARRQMLAGHLPLLNPYSGAGEALLGNGQAAPFSLVSLLSLPIQAARAQGLRAFLKILLALLGTFLAARELGCRPVFSLVAALAYAFGGSIAVWQLFPHAEVMALFPFAWLGLERTLKEPGDVRARLLLFFAVAGLLLAGHPETALMAGLALFVRTLLALRSSRRAALVALVVMGLGTGLASFFLFPVVNTVLSSEKLGQQGSGHDPELGNGGPWWASLVDTAAPGIFGTPQRSEEHGPAPLHWLAEGCGGLLCLVFAFGGIVAFGVRGPTERFLTGLMLASFALNFDAFGLPSRLFALPGLSAISLRYTAYVGGFVVALLAARALTLWCASDPPGLRARVGLLGATLAGVALAVASRSIVFHVWHRNGSFDALGPEVLGEASFHWRIALLVAAGLLLCLGLRRWPLAAGGLAAGVTLLPLLTGFGGYVPTVSAATVYPAIPLLDLLRQDNGLYRVTGTRGVFFANSSTPYQIADLRTHDPTEPARYVDWLVDLLSLDRRTYKKQYRRPTPAHDPFLRLLGVRYLLSGPDLALKAPWVDRGLFRQTRLWELGGDTRWAFFPAAVVPAVSAVAARDAIRQQRDPYALASLEIPGPGKPEPNGEGAVRSVKAAPSRIEIEVDVRQDSWLVVSQSALRGWRASGDHGALDTAIADGTLLAVRVPAGSRKIVLRYFPGSLLAGVVGSLASLLGFAVLCFRVRTRT
ncbi:MAG TPA: YfhO family protein [Thermoanaerobaculia bacterium]|nr:YfhO family protein [Thermoanaerobaculia bacterium]